jgi:hypothetical protein
MRIAAGCLLSFVLVSGLYVTIPCTDAQKPDVRKFIAVDTSRLMGQPDAHAIEGTLSACYRITLNGLREYRKFHGVEIVEESPQPAEKSLPRFTRKKKQRAESPEATATPYCCS